MIKKQYLDFISNEDLYECLGELYKSYKEAVNKKDLKDFLKNKIDPVRLKFDSMILGKELSDVIEGEVLRQQDKTISNAIGTFQENLISKIADHQKLKVGGKIDIVSDKYKHIAEIKNKHNTLKGENNVDLFNKLQDCLDSNYRGYTAYYVRIIDTTSRNEIWEFKRGTKKYRDSRIRRISGDKFYALITGDPKAFQKLVKTLPIAMSDYIESLHPNEVIKIEESQILKELDTKDSENLFTELLSLNFKDYTGFN